MAETEEIYEKKLKPGLLELETQRMTIMKNRVYILLAVLVLLLFHALLILGLKWSWFFIIPTAIIGAVAGVLVYRRWYKKDDELAVTYRDMLIKESAGALLKNSDYLAEGYVPYESFQESRLFMMRPEHYSGKHLVTGKSGELEVQFSEISAGMEGPATSPIARGEWIKIFEGFFLEAQAKQPLRTDMVVLPDSIEDFLGVLGKNITSYSFHRGSSVRTGDTDFLRQFTVYADKPLDGIHLLSPELMRKIVAFKRKTEAVIYISCIGSKIFVALIPKQEVLSFQLERSLLHPLRALRYYQHLSFMLEIARDIYTQSSS